MECQIEAFGILANADATAKMVEDRLTQFDDSKAVRNLLRQILRTFQYISNEVKTRFPEKPDAA